MVEHCGLVFCQPAPAGSPVLDDRLVYLGDDTNGRALEVVAVEMEAGPGGEQHLGVIHAMELRGKYRGQYEEARKWRM